MVEALPTDRRQSPLGATSDADHALASGPGIDVVEIPFLAQLNLRADPDRGALENVEASIGVLPPTNPNESADAASSGLSVLWLAPDEWLIVGRGDPAVLASTLERAVRPSGGSIVDVSAHRTVLELRGPQARDLLGSGCSVDLHPRVFAVGQCAQTQFARVDVILQRVAEDILSRLRPNLVRALPRRLAHRCHRRRLTGGFPWQPKPRLRAFRG